MSVDDDPAHPEHAESLQYQETTKDEYATFAAQHFAVEEPKPGTLVLRGPCPRCHTVIDVPIVSKYYSSRQFGIGLRRHRPDTAVTEHLEPMMCTCEDEHPNRPQGLVGCGAYWNLIMSRQEP